MSVPVNVESFSSEVFELMSDLLEFPLIVPCVSHSFLLFTDLNSICQIVRLVR